MMDRACLVNLPVILFLCVVYSNISSAVIYQLNDTEYKRMPPVFHVDSYEECLQDLDGVYCFVELALVTDGHSPLMDLITEYSEYTVGHYNHSSLRYSLCFTNTCKEFYDNTTGDLVLDLEACLNKTFEDKYGLKTKVAKNDVHCKEVHEEIKKEMVDYFMFALMIGILIVNTVGSLYDFICTNGEKEDGNLLLTSFSIRRNWRKLVAPPLQGPDSRLERLKGLSCLKFISTVFVIMAHTTISSAFYLDNTKFMEDIYQNIFAQFIWSGAVLVQTFFVISGFFLSYNLELMSEKSSFKVNWMLVPKGIVLRWIRLTPAYAFVLFFTVTVNKYIITGPHWYYAGITEIEDCKQYWWQHLLYINNYNNRSLCMPHTWYLAADTQLYVLGLLIYVTCRSASSRKVVLPLLVVVAIVIPVLQTYWQDLNGMLVVTPEHLLRFLMSDPTFNHLYKPGHTNMVSYLVGLIVGLLAYHGQKVNFDAQKYRKYRVPFYCMIPLGVAMVWSGCIFYRSGPRPSLAIRMFFAAYQKFVWSLFIGIGMLAVIFKYETLLRDVVEWNGWTALSRLSYCAYFLHVTVIRVFIAFIVMSHASYISMIEHILFIEVASFLLALPTWLLLEQPASRLLTTLLRRSPKDTQNTDTATEINNEEYKKNIFDEQLTIALKVPTLTQQ